MFAWSSSQDDIWNIECFNLLLKKLNNTGKMDDDYSEAYWKDMITDKFDRLRRKWKDGQMQPDETEMEWEERVENKNSARLKKARHVSRRHDVRFDSFIEVTQFMTPSQTLKNRVEIVELVIKVKRLRKDADVRIWEWIRDLLRHLKAEGMSSEETDVDGTEVVHWVKIMLWRRAGIADIMDIIDAERKDEVKNWKKQGASPIRRLRDKERQLISSRRYMDSRPRALYEEEWLSKPTNAVRVNVSKETFEWLSVVTRASH
jgi:hypothetical protein